MPIIATIALRKTAHTVSTYISFIKQVLLFLQNFAFHIKIMKLSNIDVIFFQRDTTQVLHLPNLFIQIFESLKKSRTPYAKHSILLFSNVIDPPPSPLAKNLRKHGSSLPLSCIFNPTVYYILTPLGV